MLAIRDRFEKNKTKYGGLIVIQSCVMGYLETVQRYGPNNTVYFEDEQLMRAATFDFPPFIWGHQYCREYRGWAIKIQFIQNLPTPINNDRIHPETTQAVDGNHLPIRSIGAADVETPPSV